MQRSEQYCLGVAKSREVRVKPCAVQCGDGWAMTRIVMFWHIYVLIRVGTVRSTYLMCVEGGDMKLLNLVVGMGPDGDKYTQLGGKNGINNYKRSR